MNIINLKNRIIALIVSCVLLALPILVLVSSSAHAAPADPSKTAACEGVKLTGGSCGGSSSTKITGVVTTVINILSWVIGVTAVIMVMIGGFKYITSTGDSNSVNSAKNTILYALVGLVIAALAQVIVKFVLGKI